MDGTDTTELGIFGVSRLQIVFFPLVLQDVGIPLSAGGFLGNAFVEELRTGLIRPKFTLNSQSPIEYASAGVERILGKLRAPRGGGSSLLTIRFENDGISKALEGKNRSRCGFSGALGHVKRDRRLVGKRG